MKNADKIKSWIRKTKAATYIWAVLLALLGILMLMRPGAVITVVCALIGIVLLVFGAILVIRFATKGRERRETMSLVTLVLGFLLIVVGFYILRNPLILAGIAGMLLAVYLTVYGLIKLVRVLRLPARGFSWWWLSLAGALLTLIFGIIFLLQPLSGPELIIRLAGLALIYAAVISVIFSARAGKVMQDTGERIQGAINTFEDEMSRQTGKDLYGKEIIDGTAEVTESETVVNDHNEDNK